MSRRRIATVSAAATLVAACALLATPASGAATPPPVSSTPQPTGLSAFNSDDFTVNPAPDTRKGVIANAREALATHERGGHVKSGDAFTPRTVVVAKNGAADVRFDRTFHGLPVYGGDLVVHLKPGGSYRALDTATPARAVSTTPKVPAARAVKTSRRQLTGTVGSVSKPHLAVWATGRSSKLVWETVVRGVRADHTLSVLHVMVDARKGGVVTQYDEVHTLLSPEQQQAAETARATAAGKAPVTALTAGTGNSIYSGTVPIDLTKSGGTWTMKDPSHGNGTTSDLDHAEDGDGTIFSNSTGTFGNGTNSDPSSAGVDAHYGAAETYDYYKNVHGRNGIFGDGRGVPSQVHVGDGWDNAQWTGAKMQYGDNVNNDRPLVELDVAGHEMSHGVSGALVHWGTHRFDETHALNEGTSDIFGTMVEFYANNPHDKPDYTMGELINFNGGNKPLRYMYDPSLDGASPDCYSAGIGDRLDPHLALGPLDHWFFLLAVGSGDHGYGKSPTCNKSTLGGIGNDKAAKIWYKTLASYAKSNEDYASARTDSLKVAAELYGTHCAEYNAVNAAWAAVSVTGDDPVPGTCAGQAASPTVTSPGNQTSTVGTAVSRQIHATDPNGQTLTYSATGLPAGLSINSSTGLISGSPTAAGTSSVTVTAKNTSNVTGSATFTWKVNPAPSGCPTSGNKVGNGGFESGTTPWTTTAGVISANGGGETAHSGTHFAWLDGYGTTHTDTATQSVTIPAGCKASLSLWLHIYTAESGGTAHDKLTIKIGTTTLATYDNTKAASGYTKKTFDVSSYAGHTVTLSFSGTENSSRQTGFVIDDVAINAS